MKVFVVLCAVFIGAVVCEIGGAPDLQSLQANLNNITTFNISSVDISGLNLPINTSRVPSLEDAEKVMQDKCKKNGDEGAYERTMVAKDEAQVCIASLVNVTELHDEMEKAKPTGDLDIVFKKYCKKSPILQDCISNFTSALEPCLDQQEKESKRIIHNITASLLNFICFNEGDRIALFIAEGGPECFQLKKEAIRDCINATAAGYINTDLPLSSATLPSFVLNEKECRDVRKIQQCVVHELEGCEEPTPSNIVSSLFDYVWQITPCNNMKQESLTGDERTGSGHSLAATAAVVFSAVLAAVAGNRLH